MGTRIRGGDDVTGVDLERTKAQWIRPRAHRLLVEGLSPSQADQQAEQWWPTSIEGQLVAEVERLRARITQLEATRHQRPRTDGRTYLCCPCCDELPGDHPNGVRDHHTIYCGNAGCITGDTLKQLEKP